MLNKIASTLLVAIIVGVPRVGEASLPPDDYSNYSSTCVVDGLAYPRMPGSLPWSPAKQELKFQVIELTGSPSTVRAEITRAFDKMNAMGPFKLSITRVVRTPVNEQADGMIAIYDSRSQQSPLIAYDKNAYLRGYEYGGTSQVFDCPPNNHYKNVYVVLDSSKLMNALVAPGNYQVYNPSKKHLHSIEETLIHELGHALFGIKDYEGSYNNQGQGTFFHRNGSSINPYIGSRMVEAMTIYQSPIYPKFKFNPGYDISVVHFKFHRKGPFVLPRYPQTTLKTRIYDGLGNSLPRLKGYYRFLAKKGDRIKAEFTFENNSPTHPEIKNIEVGYVLSRRSTIPLSLPATERWIDSRNFIELGTRTIPLLKRGTPTPVLNDIDIPASTGYGPWYLGVIVDPKNKLNDFNRWNNATYLPLGVIADGFGENHKEYDNTDTMNRGVWP